MGPIRQLSVQPQLFQVRAPLLHIMCLPVNVRMYSYLFTVYVGTELRDDTLELVGDIRASTLIPGTGFGSDQDVGVTAKQPCPYDHSCVLPSAEIRDVACAADTMPRGMQPKGNTGLLCMRMLPFNTPGVDGRAWQTSCIGTSPPRGYVLPRLVLPDGTLTRMVLLFQPLSLGWSRREV